LGRHFLFVGWGELAELRELLFFDDVEEVVKIHNQEGLFFSFHLLRAKVTYCTLVVTHL
jgi:hypothetical protein